MKKLMHITLVLVFIFIIMGCGTKEIKLNDAWDSIKSTIPSSINEDFNIPTLNKEYNDVSITWTSDNESIIANNGKYIQPVFDTNVTFNVLLEYGNNKLEKEITIKALGKSAQERVASAKSELNIPQIVSMNLDFSSIESTYGVTISIDSNNQDIITNAGIVKPVGIDIVVELTLTISDQFDTEVFDTFNVTTTVHALTDSEQVEYVKNNISIDESVSQSLTLPSVLSNYSPTITWSSDKQEVIANDGTFVKPENCIDVTLTATITLNNETTSISFVVNAVGYTAEEKVKLAADNFNLSLTTVTDNFSLPNSADYGTIISWQSTNSSVIVSGNTAEVTRPGYDQDDKVVTLKATFTLDGAKIEKIYEVTIEAYRVSNVELIVPSVDKYYIGDTVDLTDGKFTLTLDDGSTASVKLTHEMATYDFSIAKQTEVILDFLGSQYQYTVDVISHITNEELEVGESLMETFDDLYHPIIGLDVSQVPNTEVINDESLVLSGNSLYYESAGSYASLFINSGITYTPGAKYRITFDYKLLEFVDTLYFQLTGSTGNLFTQFGGLDLVGTEQTFTYEVTLGDISDYVIQIFPGGATGKTGVIIDNFKIERVLNEPSKKVDGEIAQNDYVYESFGDSSNKVFNFDSAATNSVLTSEEGKSLDGTSLYFESEGLYSGIYLNETFTYTPGAKYRITFDYKLLELADTLYFQLTGSTGNLFTQFGGLDQVGTEQTFTYEVTLGDTSDYIIQIFPGEATGKTSLIIDNVKVERISVESSKKVDGEIVLSDYVYESFGDTSNQVFNLDPASTNSVITSEEGKSLDGTSLYFESEGSYSGVYLNETFTYTPGAEYRITFDYKLLNFADTIYFQLTGSTGNLFTQFGGLDQVGTEQTFTYEVTLGDTSDYVIQIFPGGATEKTSLIIDNIKVERIS